MGDSATATGQWADRTVLLTGAGGYIGSAVAKAILSEEPRQLVLLDHSEQALYQLERSLACLEGAPRYRLVPGDVGDAFLIAALLEEYRPDLLVHAAAYKHVPLMELNPFAAVQNNAILTWRLAELAAAAGVPRLLLVSTDKAANPRSILGASKRVAEQAVLRWSATLRPYAAIRLVNVFGSTGSVVPLFQEQIRRGGPLTITHPEAARYFLTLEEAVGLILVASAAADAGVVYIPKVSDPVRIVELARVLLRHTGAAAQGAIPTEFGKLRPGEKLVEDLLSAGESPLPTSHPAIQALAAPHVCADVFDRALLELTEIVRRRDLAALLQTLRQLVPDYQPSSTLCLAEQTDHD